MTDEPPVPGSKTARTRQRILEAGADLLHGFPIWNWSALTVPAVASRAGVTERTVYRYFTSERNLRDAVMEHMAESLNVNLDGLALEDIAELTQRILRHSSEFPLVPRTPRDDTIAATNAKQRAALLAAVEPHTEGWTETERAIAAGMLDVLWSNVSYERLVGDWELPPAAAIRASTWAIRLVEEAIRKGQRPD